MYLFSSRIRFGRCCWHQNSDDPALPNLPFNTKKITRIPQQSLARACSCLVSNSKHWLAGHARTSDSLMFFTVQNAAQLPFYPITIIPFGKARFKRPSLISPHLQSQKQRIECTTPPLPTTSPSITSLPKPRRYSPNHDPSPAVIHSITPQILTSTRNTTVKLRRRQ